MKRRLVVGVDFDGWSWKCGKPRDEDDPPEGTLEDMYDERLIWATRRPGKWVRVKLIEIGDSK